MVKIDGVKEGAGDSEGALVKSHSFSVATHSNGLVGPFSILQQNGLSSGHPPSSVVPSAPFATQQSYELGPC